MGDRRARALLSLWIGVASAACGAAMTACGGEQSPTAILVAVDSDIEDLDSITIGVTDFGDQPLAEARLGPGEQPLPRTLGLVNREGPLGPISITVKGHRGGNVVVVHRRSRVFFVRDQVMLLRMNLLSGCIDLADDCEADQTCGGVDGAPGCRDVAFTPSELTPWHGEVPPLEPLEPIEPDDAGVPRPRPDAGMEVLDGCPGDSSGTGTSADDCRGLIDALVHRYRFDGTGTTMTDMIGGADGSTSTPLAGTGALAMAGGTSGDHASLPGGLLSGMGATTVELWITWQGSDQDERPLSFGTAMPAVLSRSYCRGNADYHAGSWYHFCTVTDIGWNAARRICEDGGGYLAAIGSAEEDQFIDAHPAFTRSIWIGANDIEAEGEWYFANAEGLQAGPRLWSGNEMGNAPPGVYTDWRMDVPQPDDAMDDYDCGFVQKTSKAWMSFTCGGGGAFLCEWQGHQGPSMGRGVWFTPADSQDLPSLGLRAGDATVVAQAGSPFPADTLTHVALVLDPASDLVALYLNGRLAASASSTFPLSELHDVDNWLGRSHIVDAPTFAGSLSELRIYDRALSASQLATSHQAGPDPAFLEP